MNISVLYTNFRKRQEFIEQPPEVDELVTNALRRVIHDFLVQIASTLVVTVSTENLSVDNWFYGILERLLTTWTLVSVLNIHIHNEHRVEVPGRRFCNMILVDSYKSLVATNISSYNQQYDTNEYYFIFLQARDAQLHSEMELILKHCWQHYWINCNVMVQTAVPEILVYTYIPFSESYCHEARPTLINSFNGSNWISRKMFPKKLSNMHGCSLKVATWHVPPFVIFKEGPNGQMQLKTGMEIMLLRTLASLLNFRVEIVKPTGTDLYGTIYENGTLTGALEMLATRKADLSIGYFRKSLDRIKVVTSIFSHCHTPVVVALIRDHYKYNSVEMLTFPFKFNVWLTLLISCLLLMTLSVPISNYPVFHVINILFGMPALRLSRSNSRRLFAASWILGAFVLRSSYQALLFHLFRTSAYSSIPNSLEALSAANYKVFGTQDAMNLMLQMPVITSGTLKYFVLNTSDEMATYSHLEAQANERIAAVGVLNFVTHYRTDRTRQTRFHLLSRPVNMQQLTIYFTKHSYLSDKVNENVLLFGSSGFITAYVRRYARSLSTYEAMRHENTLIGYENLKGLYLIVSILLSISAVVFLMELMSVRIQEVLRKFGIPF